MATQSNPVQQLLNAEHKARILVNDARARKSQRLKQARAEVADEINAYREQCEKECKEQEQEIMSSLDEIQKKVEEDVKKELANNYESVTKNMDQALALLLGAVCDVKCELHVNYDIEAGKAAQAKRQATAPK